MLKVFRQRGQAMARPICFRWSWFLIAAVVSVGASTPPATQTGDPDRVVLVSPKHPTYLSALDTVEADLGDKDFKTLRVEVAAARDWVDAARAFKPDLIVVAGSTCIRPVLDEFPNVPVVFTMIPNALDSLSEDVKTDQNRVSGVTTDISPAAQLAWIAGTCPGVKTVGVLHSPSSLKTVEALVATAATRGIKLIPVKTDKQDFAKALRELSEKDCQSVLMLPDAQVYTAANVQGLLLWGLRQKRPVYAFSPNLVKAGALAGQYSEIDVVGRQTADVVRRILKGADPRSVGLEYPQRISRALNLRTADMIGVSVDASFLKDQTLVFGDK